MSTKKYIDSENLRTFLDTLKTKYASNDAKNFVVKHSWETDQLATARNLTVTPSKDTDKEVIIGESVAFDGSSDVELKVEIKDATVSDDGVGTHGLISDTDIVALKDLEEKALVEDDIYHNENFDTEYSGMVTGAEVSKSLFDRIQDLESRGRFLTTWNAKDGSYEQSALSGIKKLQRGDYFIVSDAYETETETEKNLKPSGTDKGSITPIAHDEDEKISSGDTFYFDGTDWKLQVESVKSVVFKGIGGDALDNKSLEKYYGLLSINHTTTDGKYISGIKFTGDKNAEQFSVIEAPLTSEIDDTTAESLIAPTTNAVKKYVDDTITKLDSEAEQTKDTNGLYLKITQVDGMLSTIEGEVNTANTDDINAIFNKSTTDVADNDKLVDNTQSN